MPQTSIQELMRTIRQNNQSVRTSRTTIANALSTFVAELTAQA